MKVRGMLHMYIVENFHIEFERGNRVLALIRYQFNDRELCVIFNTQSMNESKFRQRQFMWNDSKLIEECSTMSFRFIIRRCYLIHSNIWRCIRSWCAIRCDTSVCSRFAKTNLPSKLQGPKKIRVAIKSSHHMACGAMCAVGGAHSVTTGIHEPFLNQFQNTTFHNKQDKY